MRAVNLLPEQYRPRRPSGSRAGGAYVVVGVLGALLLASVVYVLTSNQVSSRQTETAKAKRETATAEGRSKALAPVAAFVNVKQQREQSVKQLAAGRFDWERLVLELSRVVPNGVFVTDLSASTTGQTASPGGAGASAGPSTPPPSSTSSPTAASADGASGPPTLTLTGCAPTQDAVATTLVRLRSLHGAKDVKLASSDDKRANGAAGAAGAAAASPTPGAPGQAACKDYTFVVSVVFDPSAAAAVARAPAGKVPASLGGGS